MGGSSPCNIDFIFIVLNISFNFVMTLFFRNALSLRVQPVAERPHSLSTHGLTCLIFFVDTISIVSTHRVHGVSAAWCFCNSVVQWYTGTGVSLPFPNPLKLLCCRCYLNFRPIRDIHHPCYWCEIMSTMGYPPP